MGNLSYVFLSDLSFHICGSHFSPRRLKIFSIKVVGFLIATHMLFDLRFWLWICVDATVALKKRQWKDSNLNAKERD